jgi:hypothetical protein
MYQTATMMFDSIEIEILDIIIILYENSKREIE